MYILVNTCKYLYVLVNTCKYLYVLVCILILVNTYL